MTNRSSNETEEFKEEISEFLDDNEEDNSRQQVIRGRRRVRGQERTTFMGGMRILTRIDENGKTVYDIAVNEDSNGLW